MIDVPREGPLTGPEGAAGAATPAELEELARTEFLERHPAIEAAGAAEAAALVAEAEAVQAAADGVPVLGELVL